jgi:FkbM family methyltransferase
MNIKRIADYIINKIVLKVVGLELRYTAGSDPVEDLRRLFRSRDVRTIVDGGAYRGTFSRQIARVFPRARIFAFEPTPASHDLLTRNVAGLPQVDCLQLALGEQEGTAVFYANRSPLTNSLRQSSNLGHRYFRNLVAGEAPLTVEVTTLSDFAHEYAIDRFDLVKLDLQGNELDALRGMDHLAPLIQGALIEVQFVPLYAAAPTFSDVETWMRQKGLVLYQLYELVRDPGNGRLLYGDALFIRPEVLRESEEAA